MLSAEVVGLGSVLKKLSDVPKRVRLATVLGINWTAKQAHDDVVKAMPSIFDRPTPYTMRGFYVWRADKNNLQAKLEARTFAGKGTPAYKYLSPEVYGGGRGLKGHERALRAAGILPGGMFTVPASGAPRDSYGNLPGSEYVRILSELRAFGEQGYTANITARSAARKKKAGRFRAYFAITPAQLGHGGLRGAQSPGVYRRTERGIKPILIFVRRPSYRKRFPFHEIAKRSVDANYEANFNRALMYQMGGVLK
jgi:hypothetical protein